MKFKKYTLIFASIALFQGAAFTQDLKLKINTIPIEGDLETVEVEIFTCDPDQPKQTIMTSDRHKIVLPAGDTYFLTYNAPNFIAKTIQIDVPANLPSKTTVEYQMNMFPQMDGGITLAYYQPVGYISFDEWFNVKVEHDYNVEIQYNKEAKDTELISVLTNF